ncbi:MAG: Nicotinamidase [Parcubacteria bacterium C7867-001]|nr:MAG: Nicotinamidase [Parcubacteria bacterium C7867-001]
MAQIATALPVPKLFNAKNAGVWSYRPDQRAVFNTANDWKRQYQLKASGLDVLKVMLLLIDLQKDFCFPEGSLFVGGRSGRGAIDDSARIAEFIYRNLNMLTSIATTLDTHFAYQCFFPSFWNDESGQPLQPFDVIMGNLDIMRAGVCVGKASVNPSAASVVAHGDYVTLQKQMAYYCQELDKGGKYNLIIWPEHCLLGSDGHVLAGVIHEARLFHAYARASQSLSEIKGGSPYSENYSVLRPEVMTTFDGQPLPGVQKNVKFIKTLLAYDRVIIAGQAGSHCLKSSTEDFLEEILIQDKSLARKVYVLADCTSAVTVPDGSGGFIVDNTPNMEAAFAQFANAGMNIVKSTTPIQDWPGFMH